MGEQAGPPTHSFLDERCDPRILAANQRLLADAIRFGGFPEVLTADSPTERSDVLKNYRNTYFTRDLAHLSNIENTEGLLAVLMHAARSIGSHLEVSSFARESGLSFPTAKKYINTIVQSQLGLKLYGYQFGPAKRYVKASKLYFADNGILGALTRDLSAGQQFENFVISEFSKRQKLGYIRTDQLFYYKSSGGAEIDLLYEVDDYIIAIEIKASTKIDRKDIRNLVRFRASETKRPVQAYVIYRGDEYGELESVRFVPVGALCRGV